jgi:gluconate 5-dehydrogenase
MKKNYFDLSGRTAVITGAGSGLGRTMAVGLAQYGANVTALDLNKDTAEETAEMVRAEGQKALAVQCDVTSVEQVSAAIARTVEQFGTIDVLINSAAATKYVPSLEFNVDDWMHVVNVNLKGSFICCQAAGRVMAKQKKGSIINMSSIYGIAGVERGISPYATSKAGINGLTRMLAVEWGPLGIRVNAMVPCQFRSKGFEQVLGRFPDPPAMLKSMVDKIPLGRIGEPDEIVGSTVYLASDASAMVTGHLLYIDGGFLAR